MKCVILNLKTFCTFDTRYIAVILMDDLELLNCIYIHS